MQRQAKQTLLHQLDADQYDPEQTVILTIPLSLPYPIYQNGFERVDGEFEYHGEYYKLVKQKLENDVLHLVCIKDTEARKIAQAMVDYSKLANDIPSGTKQAQNFLAKLFKDYQATITDLHARENVLIARNNFCEFTPSLVSIPFAVNSPPPEKVS